MDEHVAPQNLLFGSHFTLRGLTSRTQATLDTKLQKPKRVKTSGIKYLLHASNKAGQKDEIKSTTCKIQENHSQKVVEPQDHRLASRNCKKIGKAASARQPISITHCRASSDQ